MSPQSMLCSTLRDNKCPRAYGFLNLSWIQTIHPLPGPHHRAVPGAHLALGGRLVLGGRRARRGGAAAQGRRPRHGGGGGSRGPRAVRLSLIRRWLVVQVHAVRSCFIIGVVCDLRADASGLRTPCTCALQGVGSD